MNRILFDTSIGNLLCSDIYKIIDNKRKLLSEEVDIDDDTRFIFEQNENLTMQIWIEDDKLNFATRVKGFTRQTRIERGLFSKFYKQIEKPAKGGGNYRLSIFDDKYSGAIISGHINELDNRDFKKRIDIIETQRIPQLMKILNGEIVKERIGYNV